MTKYLIAAFSFVMLAVSAFFISTADASTTTSSVPAPAKIESNAPAAGSVATTPDTSGGSGAESAMKAEAGAEGSTTPCTGSNCPPSGSSADASKSGEPAGSHGLGTTPASGKPMPSTVPTATKASH